jgi:acyl-CoA reductase-like NAD-dependent aldehyde dehydrogenase
MTAPVRTQHKEMSMPAQVPRAARVHQAAWPTATIPTSSPARTLTAKLAVLDRALAELSGVQSAELAKASGGPGSYNAERDEWLRRAVDAVQRYRGHLARRAVLENDTAALAALSASDIEAAGTQLAKASIGAGRASLGPLGRLSRRPGRI